MHLDSWDSHPRVVLTQMPPLVATAHDLLRFNARPVAGHKYHYPFCLLSPSLRIAPFRQSPEDFELLLSVGSFGCSLLWLVLSDSKRKVKGTLIFSCQGTMGLADITPHLYKRSVWLFSTRSNLNFLIFIPHYCKSRFFTISNGLLENLSPYYYKSRFLVEVDTLMRKIFPHYSKSSFLRQVTTLKQKFFEKSLFLQIILE